jgi:HSP20 family protein
MTVIASWDLFEDLRQAQDEQMRLNRLRAQTLRQFGPHYNEGATTAAWMPMLDISERKDAYLVTVELPGVRMDDLTITLEDGLLTIQGERQVANDSSDQRFHRVERRYGAFRRAITLPAHVQADAVEAWFEDGVLQVLVPKAEEAKPKRIQVRPGSQRDAIEATPPTS